MGSDVTVAATQRGWRGARMRVLLVSMLAFLVAGVTGSAHLALNNPSFLTDQEPAAQDPAAQAAAPASDAAAAAPAEPDGDGDGMPDAWETFFGLNPASGADAGQDPDNDGRTNLQEFQTSGHPFGAFKRYFAEGSTGFFDTSFGIVNLNATETAHVLLTFMGESGVIGTHQLTIPAGRRATVNADAALGNGPDTVLATVIESDKAMVADRLVRWGGNGYGSAVDAGAEAPSTTWYLSEGSTGLFQLYYLLLNPNLTAASVTVKYLREGGGPITKTYTVPAQSRASVFVNLADFGLLVSSVGAAISSNVPIVAERAMYFSVNRVFDAGTGAMGSPQLATQWQFAESATGPFFDEFVSLMNPSTTQTATATLTFHLAGGSTITRSYVVQPERRRTVYLNLEALLDPGLAAIQNATFWMTVDSDIPIASERVMWWPRGTLWYEGHASAGSTAANTSWVVPEGSAGNAGPGSGGASDQTYILIANTANTAGQVRLTLIPDGLGATSTVTRPIAALERLSIDVNAQFALNNTKYSVLVDSLGTPGVPIVVDYARYSSPGGVTWAAGGASQAIVAPVQTPPDTAPTVTATTPANGATNVSLHGNLSVTFSESVSVTPTAFTLQCPVGAPVTLTNLTASPATTFTLDPNAALPQNTICTLTVVATQVTDTDANDPPNNMAANHVITFTTESETAPTVTGTTPANGATGVTVGSNVEITFSEPVNVTGSTFVVECPGGTPIAFTNTTASPAQAFTLDPNVNLPYSTTCTVTVVAATVTDVDSNDPPDNMAADYVFSFTTESCPTVTVTPTSLPGASTGTPYSQTFSQTGLTGTVVWSLTGTLPTGMSFNTSTGELSGTPTQSGSFPITVTATGPGGCSGSVSVTLSVNCPVITVSPSSLPTGTTGTPYSQIFTQVGTAAAPITWSLTGTLPTGMSFNTATGELSGTPTQSGSFPITVTATDANGCSGAVSVTLTIECPVITVSPSTVPDATTGTPYSQVFTQAGTTGTITWSLTGTLPAGLTLNTATGELSGTPTQSGSFQVTVTATDANGCSGSVTVTITVNCPTITIGPATLPNGTAGTAYTSTQLTQTGGTLPIAWDLAAGALPAGLTLTSGGFLSGTPTATGTFNITARATDANGCTGTLAYSFDIICPTITVTTQAPVPNGVVGAPYGGVQFQQTGGSLPITWSITGGSLPTGLTLNPSTGQITGTPTQTGSFSVTVTATDANGCTGTLTINFDVTCPVITLTPAGPALTGGIFGLPYSQTFSATGGATPHTFAVTAGALPPGLTLSSGGALTGSPTNTNNAYAFTITATDNSSAACTGQAAYTLAVLPNAQPETYNGAVGNTELIVHSSPAAETTPRVEIAGSVLTNDAGPASLSAGPTSIATLNGGSVTLASNGTFVYLPPVEFNGNDTFQYTLTDGNGVSNTATVTIGVTGMVWYVNSASGVNGDGRSHSPFNTLASAHTDSDANHHVYVHTGSGATPGDITLEANQVLHGNGSAYTLGLLTLPAGGHPTLSGQVTLGPNTTVNTVTLNGTGSKLIGTNATTGTVTINTVNLTGGTTGLSLTNVPATVNVTNSTFSGITGTDVHINDGSGTVSVGATITNTAGRSVHIQNRDGGTVTFSGAISDSGTGIRLESNAAGHTTHFNGGLTLSPAGGNIGLHATTGGTVNVTGSTNTITTTNAAALHVEDTTIGASGLTFRSLTATGGQHGILLDNTGSNAGLTVTGTGAANSGGTIQNTTSHGVMMSSTRSPSFTSFRIMNTSGSGVRGTGVTHFTYVNGSISGSNDDGTAAAHESNIAFHDAVTGTENNLSGDVTITGNSLTTALYHGVDILNHSGTINSISISNNTITSTTSNVTSQGSGIRLTGWGSAGTAAHVMNANIQNNTITNFPAGAGILVFGGNTNNAGAPSTTMGQAGNGSAIVNITGNSISGASAANRINTHAIQTSVSGVGQGNFNISNNGTVGSPIQHVTGNVISQSALGLANVTSTIANNVIVANHTAGVGGAFGISVGSGQTFGTSDTATLTTTISGNTVSQTDGNGIIATAAEASTNLVARIINNTVAAPLSGFRPGIRVDSGSAIAVDNNVCLEISGNTASGSGGQPGIGLRKQGTSSTTHAFGIEGLVGTATPAIENHVNSLNPSGNGTLLISATSGFSACTAP